MTSPGPIGTGKLPEYPPMDGRDISRVRTELRLAQLSLIGLLCEEQESPPGGGTHSRVLALLQRAEDAVDHAVDVLGEALGALVDEHGGEPNSFYQTQPPGSPEPR